MKDKQAVCSVESICPTKNNIHIGNPCLQCFRNRNRIKDGTDKFNK
jgi:hypothetical protein